MLGLRMLGLRACWGGGAGERGGLQQRAGRPGAVEAAVSGELPAIEAIARYVQALGGRLDLVANFTDHTFTVTTTEAA